RRVRYGLLHCRSEPREGRPLRQPHPSPAGNAMRLTLHLARCAIGRRSQGRMTMRPGAIGGIMVSAWLGVPVGVGGAQGARPVRTCPDDAVVSGTVCMDKYEASVWRVPVPTTSNKGLVTKIRQGKATVADLQKGGATQLGVAGRDYAPCDEGGQFCADDIFAV